VSQVISYSVTVEMGPRPTVVLNAFLHMFMLFPQSFVKVKPCPFCTGPFNCCCIYYSSCYSCYLFPTMVRASTWNSYLGLFGSDLFCCSDKYRPLYFGIKIASLCIHISNRNHSICVLRRCMKVNIALIVL
jgi:hypothetical protein